MQLSEIYGSTLQPLPPLPGSTLDSIIETFLRKKVFGTFFLDIEKSHLSLLARIKLTANAGFSLSSFSILVRVPVAYYCFTAFTFRCTNISSCSHKPVNTCGTALSFRHAQMAFIFDMYPNMSAAVKLHCTHSEVIIKLLISLYTATTQRYTLIVTEQDTITYTVSSPVYSPTSFNVDYQPGTSYPQSLYGNSLLYGTPQPSHQSCLCYAITG